MKPVELTVFPNGELGLVWEDGRESFFEPRFLRCACCCARCVDEMTGRKVLQDSSVPKDVRVLETHPVGNYGLSIRWSDGHDTGIYTFQRLRELADETE